MPPTAFFRPLLRSLPTLLRAPPTALRVLPEEDEPLLLEALEDAEEPLSDASESLEELLDALSYPFLNSDLATDPALLAAPAAYPAPRTFDDRRFTK